MTISIIIPTYNEAGYIGKLVQYLVANNDGSIVDIIVCDGGSDDDTLTMAANAGVTVIIAPTKRRSVQLNYGASQAKGEVLYFIHADTQPPQTFIKDIREAISDEFVLGRYKTKFDSGKMILHINAWLTRFDIFICMGGDQTLFIERKLFEQCKGFNEEMLIMEEYEFCERARKLGKYKILKGEVLVSARKYDRNSWLTVQLANLKIVRMYKKGVTQKELYDTYCNMLNQPPLNKENKQIKEQE